MDNKNYQDVLLDELSLATKVVNNRIKHSVNYNKHSSIYKTTNEDISHDVYSNNLKEKNRVLSIIGSGDQIINSILFGAKDIVGVDISIFPKYFTELKIAAIKTLSKEDYLKYFYGDNETAFNEKMYSIIRNELKEDVQIFWDVLYNSYNPSVIYNSPLFDDFKVHEERAITNNPFLQGNNYELLKEKINDVQINYLNHNMYQINNLNIGKFDLVILSNIINYVEQFYDKSDYVEELKKYKSFLKSLPLNKDGVALSYNLIPEREIQNYFQEKGFELHKVKEKTKIYHIENEILVYKKEKKLNLFDKIKNNKK